MTTTTRSTHTNTSLPDIPPSAPVSRWVAAAVLVGGATLQLVEEMIEPPFADDQRFLQLATHTTLHSSTSHRPGGDPLLMAAAVARSAA
jgi:hypothetical protein